MSNSKVVVADHEKAPAAQPRQDRHLPGSRRVPISGSLADTPEQRAVCFFFSSFVVIDRHPESNTGFLEFLIPFYKNAERDSQLSLATQAVSMTILGSCSQNKPMQQMGRKAFGEALALTSVAIQDPVKSKSDELLVSVLALAFAEVSHGNCSLNSPVQVFRRSHLAQLLERFSMRLDGRSLLLMKAPKGPSTSVFYRQ